jgi:hypothetical protein
MKVGVGRRKKKKLKEKDNAFTLTNTIYMTNCDNSSRSTLTKIIFEVF